MKNNISLVDNIVKEEENQKNRDELANIVLQNTLAAVGPTLTPSQIQKIKSSLNLTLSKYSVMEDYDSTSIIDAQTENARVLRMFIDAKKIEGRSSTTLYNYAKEASKMFLALNKSYKYITSQDIREYLSWRKDSSNLQSRTIANMRMYLMSFFKWLWREELISKNPMDRIGVVKVEQHVVETLTDQEQEIIRCACDNERDKAIIDLLSGSGMRVSELCGLNRSDVNFDRGEVKVFGKGAKERICFLTGKAKVHLKWYLEERTDDDPALFVTKDKPHSRLTKNGVEYILKKIASKSRIPKTRLYPHLYRKSMASGMLKRGAPIEMIQNTLGHVNVATTEIYTKIDNDMLRAAHEKYVN